MAIQSIPRSPGVYLIICQPTSKIYIGSTVSCYRRWNSHRSDLRRGIHGNSHLQAAWQKYGEDAFRFIVIESCERAELRNREQVWLDKLQPYGHNGFNLSHSADVANRGKSLSLEHRAKLSTSKRGRPSPKKGITLSAEHRAKLSAAHAGRKLSPDHIAKALAGRVGKPGHKHTAESKSKLSESMRGRRYSETHCARIASSLEQCYVVWKPDSGEAIEVKGLKAFCRLHDLNPQAMYAVANDRREHHKGWRCMKIQQTEADK